MARYIYDGGRLINNSSDIKLKEIINEPYRIAQNRDILSNTNHNTNAYKASQIIPEGKIIKKGALRDGYQFGDITKTLGASTIDLGASAIKGITSIGDAAGKLGAATIAQVADWIGQDEYAERVRNNIAGKNEKVNKIKENYTPTGLLNKLNKSVDNSSVLGDKADEVAQGVGYYAGMAGLQSIGVPWQVTAGVTSVGNELSNAYANEAEDWEAWLSAGISAGAEIGSEYLTGGLKLPGTGKTTEKLLGSLTQKIKNKGLKYATELVIQTGGEGLEEVISGYGNAIGQKLTYMSEKELNELYNSDQALEDFLMGTAVSAVTYGINPNTYKNINAGRSLITGNTTDNIAVNYNSKEMPIINENNTLGTAQNIEVLPTANDYQYTESDNQKINDLRKSATKYNLTNSSKTKSLLDVAEKLIADKNYNIVFDDSIKSSTGNNVNAQITKNGNETIIKINPNSERAGEFLLVHEITHAIETDTMKQLVMDYASKNADFNNSLDSLKKTYGTEDVSDEVLADISGQLFGNQEFINSLSTSNPNIFVRIYYKIVSLANKITGNSQYSLFVKDLENKWRTAYTNNINNLLNNNIKYSTIGLKGAKNLSKNSNNRYYKNLLQYQKIASEIHKGDSLLDNLNINSLELTQWFRTKYGDWGTIITDKDAKVIKKLEPNHKYKLEDILKHDLLYEAYPNLKKLNVETIDFGDSKAFGGYNPKLLTKGIYLNNYWVNKEADYKNVLLHEINHWIEAYENYNENSRGSSLKKASSTDYKNNVGEIISNETKINSNLTQDELNSIILPEQAKSNPKYENIKEQVDEVNRKDFFDKETLSEKKGIFDYENKKNVEKNKDETKKISRKENSQQFNSLNNEYIKNEENHEELDNSSFSYDNHGRKLSKQQQEFFKDSKVRDENGNLLTVYHGTRADFNIFDMNKAGSNFENDWLRAGKGFYFTEDKADAEGYSEDSVTKGKANVKEVYLNITNPFDTSQENTPELAKIGEEYGVDPYYLRRGDFLLTWFRNNNINTTEVLQKYGYDGISDFGHYVAYDSNQIKNVDNTKPTSNLDIRYSEENNKWQEHLENNYKATGTRTILKGNRVLNPVEISKLTKEDANTTPKLPNVKVKTGDGESKFYGNVTKKTKMLPDNVRELLTTEEDIQYYETVTNEESLEKALDRLNNGGQAETFRWLEQKSSNATATDVAEGWILLKQYSDAKDYDSIVQVAKKMREIGTQAGQTVQAFNILSRLTPEGMVKYAQSELSEAYNRMIKNKTSDWIEKHNADFDLKPEEVQFIMDTMQEVSKMEDGYDKKVKLAEIQKLMTDKLPPERGAGIKSWMRISMLFNPKTQVRNIMGNAVITPVNYFSDLVSSAVDSAIYKKTGVRTTGRTNLKSYGKGFKSGLYQSYNDFKKGINTRNIEGNRFEIKEGRSFNNNTILGKRLNQVDRLLSFMLDAGDRGFYEASFTNSINNQMVLNKTNEVTQEMIDIATQEALSRTWQDNNDYTRFVLSIRKGFNKINVKGYGLGDILIPFAKTPANLTKAIVDYSPLGMVSTINEGIKLKRSLTNGQYTPQMQHQFVQNLGKATAGTMLYILGIALANAGITSGESDEDKDTANFMKNTLGINSYTIKIGNKSFSYDWAQPIAAPFAMTANLIKNQKEGATLGENITTTLDTGLNVLFEQSFLESMSNVLSEPGEIGTKLIEQLSELPSRAIPTLMKQIVDLTDDTARTTFEYDKPLKTAVNKVVAKIPGLSKTLEPTTDTMGREILRYGGKNNIFNVFLNPANVSTENISESAKEIYNIYKSTGDKTILPRVAPYYINDEGEKIILSGTEKTQFQKISGTIIEDNVKMLENNKHYNSLSDIDKAEVINGIVNYAYNKARKDVLNIEMSNQYNKVNEWLDNGGTVYDYYANKEENNYSLENPKKYNTLTSAGIDYYDFSDYQKYISDLKDMYPGEENKNKRKNEIWKYIQNLNLTKAQKILIYNTCGGYGISNYKNYMHNYINSLKISKKEKEEIWDYLYG